jgi:hypothetical protein
MEGISLMRNFSPDLAIIPVQIGVRPISGLAGDIDWICGGILSNLIKNGKVVERDGEVLMYSNLKKFPFPLVFTFFDGVSSLHRTVNRVLEYIGAKKVFLDLSTIEDIEIEKKDIHIIKFVKKF